MGAVMPATNKLDFSSAQAGDKALKQVSQLMIRAGQPVIATEFTQKSKRSNSITFREATLSLASGQIVTLRVNVTGDIYQVLLNRKEMPIKAHDDTAKAVAEIAGMAEKNQAAFQKAQARVKVEIPQGLTTPPKKMLAALTERSVQLDTEIAERKATVADLEQQLGGMTDSAGSIKVDDLDDGARDTLRALAEVGPLEDGDVPSKTGRDALVELGYVERYTDEGANVLTARGKAAAAMLDAAPPAPAGAHADPMSWLGFQVVDQLFVDASGPIALPSSFQVRDKVSVYLASDGDDVRPIDAIVVGAGFTHSKVRYTLAVPIQGTEAEQKYAVLHDVDSLSVAARGEAMLDSGQRPTLIASVEEHLAPAMQLSGAYVAAREIVLADPVLMDSADTAGAIEQLNQALAVVECNAPINEAEGNLDQAKLERRLAASFRTAIAMLDSAGAEFTDAGLAELVNIASVSAAEDGDIKDQEALAQLLALGLVETAEGLYMATAKGRSALDDAGYDIYGEPYASSAD